MIIIINQVLYIHALEFVSEMFNATNDGREVESCYRSYIVTKPTKSYIINSVIGCIVNLILFFVGTFLNALVVYVFWKTRSLRYKVSYFMIMVLSSIDVFVTLILHPAHLVMSIAEIIGKAKCAYKMFYHIAAVVLSGMSFLTFFVMNVERYLSIVHPIFHLRYVTKMRCFLVCSIFWSLTIFCGPVAYPLHLNVQIVITVSAVIVMIGTCYIYLAIFFIARKRKQVLKLKEKRRIENLHVFVVEDSTSDVLSSNVIESTNTEKIDTQSTCRNQTAIEPTKAGDKSNKTISFLHSLQLAKMYLIVVFSSFVLNLPNAIVLGMFHDSLKTINALVQSKIWTVTLVLMNSTVNSLIFFWANQTLRNEGRKVCKRLFRR